MCTHTPMETVTETNGERKPWILCALRSLGASKRFDHARAVHPHAKVRYFPPNRLLPCTQQEEQEQPVTGETERAAHSSQPRNRNDACTPSVHGESPPHRRHQGASSSVSTHRRTTLATERALTSTVTVAHATLAQKPHVHDPAVTTQEKDTWDGVRAGPGLVRVLWWIKSLGKR